MCGGLPFLFQINRQKPASSQQEEEQRLAQYRQPRVLAKSQIPPVDVLLGAGAHAGFTGDALPLRRLLSSSFRYTGHCCLQALQPGMQPSLCRCSRAKGSTGSRANTAPMGQRN